MMRPLSISLSPNTQADDVLLAFKLLFQPWKWQNGKDIKLFEEEFQRKLGVAHAVSFNSGRSAFLAILESLNFQQGDEILIQAFTCNAVPNPILWAGLKPVYVDCAKDYNMDAKDLENKITPRSKAVVVQHTFGLPADLDKIQQLCERNGLLFIEDCAHALGATYQGRKVGTFGDAAFFSFSRDKVISCVYGGVAATNNQRLAEKLRAYQEKAGYPSLDWIGQQLVHPPVINWLVLPTYRVFGKYLLVALQWLRVLSKAVHGKEKRGKKPGYFPKQLPNALAVLARKQLAKLERFNAHRRDIAVLYSRELSSTNYKLPTTNLQEHIFLRFPVQHANAPEILRKAWKQNLLLGDWYTTPVAPHDTQLEKVGYQWRSCPTAELLSRITLNLPTHIHITKKEIDQVVRFLRSHEQDHGN